MFRFIVLVVLMLNISEYLWKVRDAVLCENTYFSDDAGNTACCEGAPRESKDEDLITGDVVCSYKLISFSDDFCESYEESGMNSWSRLDRTNLLRWRRQ